MPPVYLDQMRLADLDEVQVVEREAYSTPWPSSAYRRELRENKTAHYIVARLGEPSAAPPPPVERERRPFPFSLLPFAAQERAPVVAQNPVIGHGGLWRMVDEAHITTIAVRTAYRGQGVGELLLLGLIDIAYRTNSHWLTLEVRVTNTVAQSLYHKYGFRQVGVRPRYYSDNNEDAYVMWTDPLDSSGFKAILARRRAELAEKLGLPELPDWLARAPLQVR